MNIKSFIIMIGLVFVGLITLAQSRINFDYDETGNRERREFIDLTKSAAIFNSNSGWQDAIEDKFSTYEIKIYPNPTKGRIKIELPTIDKSLNGSIQIYDANGRLIFNKGSIGPTNEIDIMHVGNGCYFLHIHYQDETLQWKIIKQ